MADSSQKKRESPCARASAAPPKLTVVKGGGKRAALCLKTPHDVARLMASAAAEMMLRRISPLRAHEIQQRGVRALSLFERVKMPNGGESQGALQRELHDLEAIWNAGIERSGRR